MCISSHTDGESVETNITLPGAINYMPGQIISLMLSKTHGF